MKSFFPSNTNNLCDEIISNGCIYQVIDSLNAILIKAQNKNSPNINISRVINNRQGLIIPVTKIADDAFVGCSHLHGPLTFPETLVSIGNRSFYGCQGLNGILQLPKGLQYLGRNSFCFTSISHVEVLVSSFPYDLFGAFDYTISDRIIVSTPSLECSLNQFYSSFLQKHQNLSILEDGPFYENELKYTIIDNQNVELSGLQDGSNLSSLVLSSIVPHNGIDYTLTTIGKKAFLHCFQLTGDLIIPNSVTSIEDWAFSYCSRFTGNLRIGNGVTLIGDSAFYGCTGFTGNLVIPNSVTSIGMRAFYDCSGFTGNLVIPNNVSSIGFIAFSDCSGFKGLTIGSNVTKMGGCIFSRCTGLKIALSFGNYSPKPQSSSDEKTIFADTKIQFVYVQDFYKDKAFMGYDVKYQHFHSDQGQLQSLHSPLYLSLILYFYHLS